MRLCRLLRIYRYSLITRFGTRVPKRVSESYFPLFGKYDSDTDFPEAISGHRPLTSANLSFIVIPAKAGIQSLEARLQLGGSEWTLIMAVGRRVPTATPL